MACGGCAERRETIIVAARSIARGDAPAALSAAASIAQSAARDIRRVALAAAHRRLKR